MSFIHRGKPIQLTLEELIDGHVCDTCARYVKLYRRKFTKKMAASLLNLWHLTKGPGVSFHYRDWVSRGDSGYAMLAHWGFATPVTKYSSSGKELFGHWEITQAGCDAIEGRLKFYHAIYMYDLECVGFDGAEEITFSQSYNQSDDFTLLKTKTRNPARLYYDIIPRVIKDANDDNTQGKDLI